MQFSNLQGGFILKIIDGISVEIKGSGETIVFLHGFMSNKESFYYQTEFLSKKYKTVAIDITGFGASKKLPYPYSLNDYVKDVINVITALNITKYHLVAHSFGVRIGLRLAQKDERLNKLVIIGGAGLKPKRKISYYYKVYKYKILKRFLTKEKMLSYGSQEYKLLQGAMRESYVMIVNEHQDSEISAIKNKTLIIYGEKDSETPLYMANKFSKKIKNSLLYIVKDSGHFCFTEKPNEVNVLIKEFLG